MDSTDNKFPSSARPLTAREMNDLRFSSNHTILTPEYLRGSSSEMKTGEESAKADSVEYSSSDPVDLTTSVTVTTSATASVKPSTSTPVVVDRSVKGR